MRGDRLAGRVAVITGATSGIGAASARLFAAESAAVVIGGRNAERGEALAAELGERVMFVRCDVLVEEEIVGLIDTATAAFGRLDCLFNNAGGPARGALDDATPEQFDYAMALLARSVLLGIKHSIEPMKAAGGGSIINNSSIAAVRPGQSSLLYSVAKAAVSHLTRIAAVELGPWNIRVNTISPGAIATPIFWSHKTVTDDEAARKMVKLRRSLAGATPLPRGGEAEDIANAALYLATDAGSFVNGLDLVVDGGRTWDQAGAS